MRANLLYNCVALDKEAGKLRALFADTALTILDGQARRANPNRSPHHAPIGLSASAEYSAGTEWRSPDKISSARAADRTGGGDDHNRRRIPSTGKVGAVGLVHNTLVEPQGRGADPSLLPGIR